MKPHTLFLSAFLALTSLAAAADLPGSKDPTDVKRYEGSEIIGYQKPKYDEYFAGTGRDREFGKRNPYGQGAMKLEGLVSRWTYLIPDTERTPTEVFANYKQEFQRLGLETVYSPDPDTDGWYGPAYSEWEDKAKIGQILEYNEGEERYLIAKSTDAEPVYYVLFVTAYKDGIIPESLKNKVKAKTPLVQLDIITPAGMEEKMVLVNAEEMRTALDKTGHIALYGLYFDTDKDTLKEDSRPALAEIIKLLKESPDLKLYVVGHTDNQGSAAHNADLSLRRATSIVRELTSGKGGIPASRLAPHGAGLYSPVASNSEEAGRAKNRRVELVEQ